MGQQLRRLLQLQVLLPVPSVHGSGLRVHRVHLLARHHVAAASRPHDHLHLHLDAIGALCTYGMDIHPIKLRPALEA